MRRCLSVAAEKAALPYFDGRLGEIKIPGINDVISKAS